jgi:hypothetical protein
MNEAVILLDTNVVSELMRPKPAQAVLDWFAEMVTRSLLARRGDSSSLTDGRCNLAFAASTVDGDASAEDEVRNRPDPGRRRSGRLPLDTSVLLWIERYRAGFFAFEPIGHGDVCEDIGV